MPLWECPVCHGTFRDPQPLGVDYYHVCPPLSVAELLALDRAIVLGLAPELPADFTREDVEQLLRRRIVERPGARNENVTPGERLVRIQDGTVLVNQPAVPIQPHPARMPCEE